MVYISDMYAWEYTLDDSSQLVYTIQLTSDATCSGCMMLIYLIITVKLCLTKYQTGANALSQKEKMAILQSFVICLANCCAMISFCVFPLYIDGKWSTFGCILFWIFSSGTH